MPISLGLAKLRALFPDAMAVVPFRNPVDHVGSMVRQHANFTTLHDADPFAQGYMRDIGHFDFGRNFRAIDFGGWLNRATQQDRMSSAFWLEYWCAAFEHCLAGGREQLLLLDYDELSEAPEAVLARLGAAIGVAGDRRLVGLSRCIRPSACYNRMAAELPPALLERASALHGRLRATKV